MKKAKAAALFVGGVLASMAAIALIDRFSGGAISNALNQLRTPTQTTS